MTPQDIQFTRTWWDKLLADDERMVRWLQKLQETEFSGYQDNRDAAEKWTESGSAQERIFLATGDDELRHSDLLINVLKGRGAWPSVQAQPESLYWTEMEKEITSLERCAAVFHFGEQLASDRFEVLLAHEGTPHDIRAFLIAALPDERHHARIFYKLASPEALNEMSAVHDRVVLQLKGA